MICLGESRRYQLGSDVRQISVWIRVILLFHNVIVNKNVSVSRYKKVDFNKNNIDLKNS